MAQDTEEAFFFSVSDVEVVESDGFFRRQVHVSILIRESDVVGEDLKLQSPFCQSDSPKLKKNLCFSPSEAFFRCGKEERGGWWMPGTRCTTEAKAPGKTIRGEMQQHAELMQTNIRRKMFAPALMVVETR